MKCLLVVVLASACGGALPLQYAPIVEYPRGPHVIDNSSRCRLAVAQHAGDYALTCASTYHH